MASALKRRRGTTRRSGLFAFTTGRTSLIISVLVALMATALLLGLLLGTHLLLSTSEQTGNDSMIQNLVQKERHANVRGSPLLQQQQQQAKQPQEPQEDEELVNGEDAEATDDWEEQEENNEQQDADDEVDAEEDNSMEEDDAAAAARRIDDPEQDAEEEEEEEEDDEVVDPLDEVGEDDDGVVMDAPAAGGADDDEVQDANYGIQQQRRQQQITVDGKGDVPSGPYPYKLDKLVPKTYDFTTWTAPGGDRYAEYITGESPYTLTSDVLEQSDVLARSRRFHVKNAMKFAWDAYTEYAYGHDEVLPQSKSFGDNWGGMGTTLVDSLDTLWLMDMKDEFWKARDWVRDHLSHDHVGSVSVFETTIRSLGGLLSAYDWSGDTAFLEKAQDLGDRLFKAFHTASGLPMGQVSLSTGSTRNIGWAGGNAISAEAGTLQLEFRYLSKVTNRDDYATTAENVYTVLRKMDPPHGLYPYFIRNQQKTPTFANNKLTFGAMSDSLYEYMLKIWLQGGRKESMYRQMYDTAIQGMHDELLQTSTPSGLTYIADKNGGVMDHKMDHLVCFMGGLLALGAYTDPLGLDSVRAQRDLTTAKALTYTCYQMYARMETGISAEYVQFYPDRDFDIGRGAPHYLLRPEAVESFFILNQLTGDPVYREWGWEVFCAIERYCKTDVAYGSLSSVRDVSGTPRNKMESFFLAETLKYLYLLQDPDTEVDVLNKHVFNTEAHPMRIFPVMDLETS